MTDNPSIVAMFENIDVYGRNPLSVNTFLTPVNYQNTSIQPKYDSKIVKKQVRAIHIIRHNT